MSASIKAIETFVREPFGLVRLTTEDGQVGYGQMAPFQAEVAALIVHRQLSPHVLGADPEDVEGVVTRCLHAEQKFLGSHLSRALAGIDTALWDLRGRAAGLPVCTLVGGGPRAVEVYGADMSRMRTPLEQLRRLADLRDRHGYAAFKVKIGTKRGLHGGDADEWPGRSSDLVRQLREGLGQDVRLYVDANGSFTPAGAREIARSLHEAEVEIFEEPCPHWELGWNAEVAAALEMPVALGEQEHGVPGHRRIVGASAARILQPDVGYIGGFTPALEVTRFAERSGVRWAPHAANRSLMAVFALHLQATAAADAVPLELAIEPLAPEDQLFWPALEVADGQVEVPTGPGWGVEIDDNWLAGANRLASNADGTGRDGQPTLADAPAMAGDERMTAPDPPLDGRYRATFVLLAILVLLLAMVQRSTRVWPIVTWPVYGEIEIPAPLSTRAALEVRVRTESGRVVVLRQEDLIEPSRNSVAEMSLEGALTDAEERAFLVKLVRVATDEPIVSMEIWRVIWRVDIHAVPPIDEDEPLRERRLMAVGPDAGEAPS